MLACADQGSFFTTQCNAPMSGNKTALSADLSQQPTCLTAQHGYQKARSAIFMFLNKFLILRLRDQGVNPSRDPCKPNNPDF